MKSSIYFLCLLFIGGSCEDKFKEDTEALSTYLNKSKSLSVPTNKSVFVVVPMFAGCKTCEEKILTWFIENQSLNDFHYIFSMSEGAKKDYEILYKEKLSDKNMSYVITDFENIAWKLDMVFTESKLYYANNGKVTEVVSLSSTNIEHQLKLARQFLSD